LLVAGSTDAQAPLEVTSGLERAAKRQGLAVLLPESPAVPQPGDTPYLFIGNLGVLSEAHLSGLAPPGDAGVDLLIWTLPPRAEATLRTIYVLGMCVWAFQPKRVRCVLAPDDANANRTRERLVRGLRQTGREEPIEVLTRPAAWRQPGTESLLESVLMSALASGAEA
jgi:hypothetical protein